jgi:hypothetical protein
MMTSNSNSNDNDENTGTPANAGPAVRTPATAIMLAFANPPQSPSATTVATECSQQGFNTVGITDVQPADVIDFSRFDQQSCVDLGDAIVLCVDANGFRLPALGGTFDIMRVQGTQITFDNFTKAIVQMMKPQATV